MIKSEDIELGGVCVKVFNEDCLNMLREMPSNSVDSIVSDPPYGISFMAKKWDYDVPSVEVWKEAMRVLKPGGHALIACGTRTQHRMVCNIEDAGFEIRDVVSWIYGSGFPKSLNISKAIDKAAGAERQVVGSYKATGTARNSKHIGAKPHAAIGDYETDVDRIYQTAPATPEAQQWEGWGTALKPACEFFTLCRKPLSEKTVAANVLKWGTGGINIDGCRVGTESTKRTNGKSAIWAKDGMNSEQGGSDSGRFPANLIHDGSQEVLDLFPETKPSKASSRGLQHSGKHGGTCEGGNIKQGTDSVRGHSDNGGSAARFFYCAKASKKDRNENLPSKSEKGKSPEMLGSNNHPTVKPTALMAYLCRLITPPQGIVLDPFMGSGSTGKAAVREGFGFVGCELDADYFEIAKARIGV